MNRPSVSCLMPIYNGSNHLGDAIRSILSQTYEDFELILIDDCSSDDSYNLAKQFERLDPRVQVFQNTVNLGLPSTLNRGIALARGIYIARMDQDDLSKLNRFSRQVKFLEDNPNVSIVGSYWEYFPAPQLIIKVPQTHDEIKVGTMLNNPFGHPTVMFRRERLVSEVGNYSTSCFPIEDYEFWCRCLDRLEGANLDEVLLLYRIHPVQSSNVHSSKQAELSRRIQIGQFQKLCLDEETASLLVDWVHRRVAFSKTITVAIFSCLVRNFFRKVYNGSVLTRLLLYRKS